MSKDRLKWTANARLDPATAYKLTSAGKNTVNQAQSVATSFRTQNLALSRQTYPQIYPLKGSHVGVGMPVVLTFDVPVKNKKEFEKNLHVKSSPAQLGTWHWYSSTEVRYRPKKYWKPGTKVAVTANLNGVNAGNGIYGQNSTKTNFTVGRSLVTKINLSSDVARVYRNGKLVRTIYVSGGKPGWQTRSGVKLIMDKRYVHPDDQYDDRRSRALQPEGAIRDADYLVGRVPACRTVECRELRPSQRQSWMHRNEHGERSLVVQPSLDRRSGDHHWQQPRHGARQRLRRLEPVVRHVQEGLRALGLAGSGSPRKVRPMQGQRRRVRSSQRWLRPACQ